MSSGTFMMGLVPVFWSVSFNLKNGPSPCTCTFSRSDEPAEYEMGPCKTFHFAQHSRANPHRPE